jgi:ubiquinone/menaquinone biosynthesis C-methylase UbiE
MVDVPTRPATAGAEQDRRTWYDVEELLDAFGVKAGSTCADLGCGSGTFTIPLARRVGMGGKVYAVDASVAALDQLKIKKPGVNIVTLRAELTQTRLPSACCDLALLAFSLSTSPDPGGVLIEAARLLKPEGRLALVEWRPVPPPPGPPIARRVRNDRMQRMLETHGFVGTQRLREGAVYYTLISRKGKPATSKAARLPTRR